MPWLRCRNFAHPLNEWPVVNRLRPASICLPQTVEGRWLFNKELGAMVDHQ